MDWSSVFDESHPVKGATAADLKEFVATICRPLTLVEIQDATRSQSNPFRQGDPLHSCWKPFDATKWLIPDRPVSRSYLEFLSWSNGGEFRQGNRWLQFLPALDPSHGVRAMLLAYQLPQYMPGAIPFAFDGGGIFYLFDMRQVASNGEYPIVCSQSGNLGWEPDECVQIAESFLEVCQGTIDVAELL